MRADSGRTGTLTNLHVTVALIAFCAALASVPPIFAQKIVERDSAGIRIVENPSREAAVVNFRLGNVVVDIGGARDDANDELRVNSAQGMRLSSSTILVSEYKSVGLFDSFGKRIASIGRDGGGPGEFRSAGVTCKTRGDTVVVDDPRNGRFTMIYGSKVVRSTLKGTYGSSLAGCFDDGTVLLKSTPSSDFSATAVTRLNRVRLDGTLVNPFPGMTFLTSHTVTHSLLPRIRVRGQRVYMGDGERSEIRVYTANAKLIQIIRTADAPTKIAAADAERALAGTPSQVRNAPRPSHFPAFANFLLDERGLLWVQDYVQKFPEVMHWTAFDNAGRLVGRLAVPGRSLGSTSAAVEFGADEVELQRFDNDGFVHLVYCRLERR